MVVEAVVMVTTLGVNWFAKAAPATWQVVLVPTTGIVITGVKTLASAVAKGEHRAAAPLNGAVPAPRPGRDSGSQPGSQPARLGGVFLALVLLGGGGLGVAAGASYAYGRITGNEPGRTVFEGKIAGGRGALSIAVTRVRVTKHFTKLDVKVGNSGDGAVSLPLFKNCRLVASDGATLEADPFRSQWPDEAIPGMPTAGTITFDGHLREGSATLTFSRAFGFGSFDRRPVVVRSIPIPKH